MPHEVIMPALGMAQDAGLIVSWLKSPGDAVKTGDPLMEVETDKATMEVEAAADGYLTSVRAAEGESVPVGDVVALISDTPEAADPHDTPEEVTAAPAPAEGKPVIMPALGMAQDSGLIVSWLKAPGDRVAADEPLMEVETDKATMEVEAGHDGWIAELIGKEGESIPVGEVIAVISADKPGTPVHRSATEAGARPPETADEQPADAADTAPAPVGGRAAAAVAPLAPIASHSGRILASPKARRLAAEEGLDLSRLAEAGHPQPYHVADLDVLRSLPAPAAAAAPPAATEEATARVPAASFDAFHAWLAGEAGAPVATPAILASFAAASLRETGEDGRLALATETARGPAASYADPDLAPLAALEPLEDAGSPALTLRDLTSSRITAASGPAAGPTLTVTRDGEALALALAMPAGTWAQGAAIAFLDGLAARIEDPLRQLL